MRVPLSWLKDYIDINLNPNQIAKILTMAGLEVDAIETVLPNFEKIVIGKVLKTEKHPNADKLTVAQVTDGQQEYQVVCGAPNCREGLTTAFALVGASITDEKGKFDIKPAKLRGIESFGMLCSAKELGLGDESNGIMEFGDSAKIGEDLASLYSDTIFELSITPNLGHCLNIIGIARELSAAAGIPVRYPSTEIVDENNDPIKGQIAVRVEDSKLCPRYACRLVKNITLKPSPDWMQKRLLACGVRPINNVVDITNYVLLETGQPLHAFDYDLIQGKEIIVRPAKENETFVTLDGKERKLLGSDLLICDKERGIALAGVMGGQNSEVNDNTKNILIESACFQPTAIRKTSKRLGLMTDSSKRFERGTDPNGVIFAANRAAMLMEYLAGGQIAQGMIDVKEKEFLPLVLTCRLSKTNALLGTHLSLSEVENIWQRLGFQSTWDGQDTFTLKIPRYRCDIGIEADLIEEVARIYGYDNIERHRTQYVSSNVPHALMFLLERKTRTQLISEGLQEFITCDLIGPSVIHVVGNSSMPEEAVVKVLNPTSIEQSILRTSLLPGHLQLVKFNYDHQSHNISGFEVGRIHFKEGDKYKEQSIAAITLSGQTRPYHWDPKPREVDFYDLKGIIENLLTGFGIENYSFKASNKPNFHTGRQASIFIDGLEIGSLGEVHPAIIRRLDVPQRVYFAEINLHDLKKVKPAETQMKDISIFPASTRDWTITLPEEVSIQEILDQIHAIPSGYLEKVSLLDIFRSERIGEGLKNITFRLVYRDNHKTIEQETVDAEHARITNQIKR